MLKQSYLLLIFLILSISTYAQEIDESMYANVFTQLNTKPQFLPIVNKAKSYFMEEQAWLLKNEKASEKSKESKMAFYTKKRKSLTDDLRKQVNAYTSRMERPKISLSGKIDKAYSKYEKAIEKKSSKSSLARYRKVILDIQNEINEIEHQTAAMNDYIEYCQDGSSSPLGLINNEAPEFSDTPPIKGAKAITNADYKDKPIIMVFYANTDKTSYAALKALSSTFKNFQSSKTIGFIGVNVENKKTNLINDLKRKTFKFPILFDNEKEIRGDFHVNYLPQVVYIDENYNIKNLYVGYSSKIKSEIREYLNDFMKAKKSSK